LQPLILRLRKPSVILALAVMVLMWSSHRRSLLMVTPRYLHGVNFLEHVSVDGIPSVDRFMLVANSYHHTLFWMEGHLPSILPFFHWVEVVLQNLFFVACIAELWHLIEFYQFWPSYRSTPVIIF
jgi:hypothetical protein